MSVPEGRFDAMDTTEVRALLEAGDIEIRRSARRRKTISLTGAPGAWVLAVPQRWRPEGNLGQIAELITRLEKRRGRPRQSDAQLWERTLELNTCYFADGIAPASVVWVENQRSRFASTTPATGAIRVSNMLREVPDWVLDSVLVHELAHLRQADHSARFKELTARYPRTGEAQTYLEGFSAGMSFATGS